MRHEVTMTSHISPTDDTSFVRCGTSWPLSRLLQYIRRNVDAFSPAFSEDCEVKSVSGSGLCNLDRLGIADTPPRPGVGLPKSACV
jgi:hypothetical protein